MNIEWPLLGLGLFLSFIGILFIQSYFRIRRTGKVVGVARYSFTVHIIREEGAKLTGISFLIDGCVLLLGGLLVIFGVLAR